MNEDDSRLPATTGDEPRADGPTTKASRAWIRAIEARAFRGIPARIRLEVEGRRQGDRPPSLVILGDNGSGKSSIVDAVQFSLQGRVGEVSHNEALPLVRNETTQELPAVAVELNNGSRVERSFCSSEEDGFEIRAAIAPGVDFDRSPLVLRRADILRFWQTPTSQRQLVFLRYFKPGEGNVIELPQERQARLADERLKAKAVRRETVRALAGLVDVHPGEIPTGLDDFSDWVNQVFYGGFDPSRVRVRRRLPEHIYEAITRTRAAIKHVRWVENEIAVTPAVPKRSQIADALADVSDLVSTAFREISPQAPVREIVVALGQESAVSLEVTARMEDGTSRDPTTTFSEANRDLIALLIFVEVARAAAAHGAPRVIVLDDVFQSVDGPIRVAAVDYLLLHLNDWQFVVTAHDRLWFEQLLVVFGGRGARATAYEIVDWTLAAGPILRGRDGGPSASLRQAISQSDPVTAIVHAGRLLEQICDGLSWRLPVRVTRRKRDRYNLGDLWPPVRKTLASTSLAPLCSEIDLYLHLRNVAGAHFNDWAQGVSSSEAKRFADAVLKLSEVVYCSQCRQWIERSPENHVWVCRCGASRLVGR